MMIHSGVHVSARCFGFGLLMLSVWGAQPVTPRQPPITLRANTRLVEVSVVVRDKKGEPVTDLRECDFTVEDEGKPQEIRFFSMESQPGAAKRAVPLPPGVFSNRRAGHAGSAGGITIILLDGLNTRWGDQSFARKNVVEYLSQIQPHDRVALYTLGKELKILHDFNEEPAELVKVLAAYRGQYTADLEASNGAIAGIASLLQEDANYYMRTRVSMTLAAFESIAKYLAGVPGRKNVLWVSGGFPLAVGRFTNDDHFEFLGGDSRYSARVPSRGAYTPGLNNPNARVTETFEKKCRHAIQALDAADVAIYPVDARGLTTNPLAFNNISTMKDIADGTGGRAYYSRNDLMKSITQAVQDSRVSYTLAYYPSEQKSDGPFRKIRVSVDRRGLSVRHRLGYYDTGNSLSDESAKEVAMRDGVWSPLDATAVALDAQLNNDAANTEALTVRLRIDLGNLLIEQRDGRWLGQFDVALVQTDEKGSEYGVRLQTVPLALAHSAYEAAREQGLVLNKTVQRNKSATALRVVVRDAASGRLGRVIIPFQKR